jgi:NAD(P)-dependent dehydrogenase (short-subunit alcohol dehydrogenase family)
MTEPSFTILITGGSRGIGAATALLAARSGWDVCLSYRNRVDDAQRVCSRIRECGRRAHCVQTDLASESEILALWREAIQQFGTINALVNNAGILEQQMPLSDFDADRLRRVFDVNVIGSILCAREAVRHMSTSHGGAGGAIVNLSSAAARLGAASEYVDYAASKAAVDAMTVGLAKEVATQGIRVNSVRPGSIHTEIHASGGEPDRVDRIAKMVPMRRGGEPEEVAEAILWLISGKASYVTGTVLEVTGGI